jgi:dihydrofolate reductase
MRHLRYNIASSLDGFIAGPSGEYNWIVEDHSIDFGALFAQFDLFVMGRKTYEVLRAQREQDPTLNRNIIVASRTLATTDRPDVRIVSDGIADVVAKLKEGPGKDIWLFGGGNLARSLFDANLVDTVEVAVMPVLLSVGLPILPAGSKINLELQSARSLPSGIQMLKYAVRHDS